VVKYRCTVCGYIFEEEKEGKKWESLPDDWVCPDCGASKDMFEKVAEKND
jgi:rubredoxin